VGPKKKTILGLLVFNPLWTQGCFRTGSDTSMISALLCTKVAALPCQRKCLSRYVQADLYSGRCNVVDPGSGRIGIILPHPYAFQPNES
jgi:hypothetical protein